ncbi:MAG TPA: hypothetical protein VLK84_04590 [Longimicrobium sp.]|nr:hypothetical protein [Longimicrobium sp.]
MPKKIRLEMEELAVESFATVERGGMPRGTVHGRDSRFGDCTYDTCQQQTVSGTMPCLCVSAAGEYSCDSTCNPDQCDCMSAPCVSVTPCG